jgi:hypothetical protein
VINIPPDPWSLPIGAFKRKHGRPTEAAGYAAAPGTGPEGETCKTCKHIHANQMAKTYYKCALMRHKWTGGPKTDIRVKSPACVRWERKEEG